MTDEKAKRKPSTDDSRAAAMRLVGIAMNRFTFHQSAGGLSFAVPVTGPPITRMLRGGKNSLRAELARQYTLEHGSVPSGSALADALLVLEGHTSELPSEELHVRTADHDGNHYIDIGDTTGRVIRIGGGLWNVEPAPPLGLYFRRTALTAAMAEPVIGGDINRLWEFLPVAESDRPLILAALIHTFVQEQPHVIVSLTGEQGTGKTTAARMLSSLVDPSTVPVRKAPKDVEAWISAASGSWVIVLDNLSVIADWLSDSLCRVVTGEGDVRRQLYTDSDLVVFKYRRCVFLTSIDVGAVRGDLADRLLTVRLDTIEEKNRRLDGDLAEQWDSARPEIFGALLTAAARIIDLVPCSQPAQLPRMADYAAMLAAVDAHLATDGLETYRERLTSQLSDSLSAEPFLVSLANVATVVHEDFSSSWLEMAKNEDGGVDPAWRPPKGWPANARAVTQMLRRHAPAMRRLGWTVDDLGADNIAHAARWRIGAPGASERQS